MWNLLNPNDGDWLLGCSTDLETALKWQAIYHRRYGWVPTVCNVDFSNPRWMPYDLRWDNVKQVDASQEETA